MRREHPDRPFHHPLHVQVGGGHTPSPSPTRRQFGAIASLGLPPTPLTSASRGPTPLSALSPPKSPGILRNAVASNRPTPNHFHVPAYRLVADLESRPRSAGARLPTPTAPSPPVGAFGTPSASSISPTQCFRCGHRRRDPTWLETEVAVELEAPSPGAEARSRATAIAERANRIEIERKLQAASDELERLVDELQAFSRSGNSTLSSQPPASRSKSTPDFSRSQQNDGHSFVSYIHSIASGLPPLPSNHYPLSPQKARYFYNIRKEELLNRQRTEKFHAELEEQESRRHHYLPNLSPSLQNDLSRLEQLLHDFQPPAHSTTAPSSPPKSRSRSLSSYSLRSTAENPLTCTALYRFEARSSRELPLNAGDTVFVRRKIDDNWIEGERHGYVGIVPINYVRFNV